MANQKKISEIYQVLDEIDHVLKRPGMYIGSTKPHKSNEWLLINGAYEKTEIEYNPGLLKLFDEIISNSVDEYKRSGKITTIQVSIKNGAISIYDNGGIPVIKHSEHKTWIPELIFSNLRAGSNFNDEDSRIVAGTNGVGASLVNIYSTYFIVETADGVNKFKQTFENNMSKRSTPSITKSSQSFTKITYHPDYVRFGLTELDDAHIAMMRKRVIDIAAANPGLKLEFQDEKFKFKTFKEYVDLYTPNSIWEKSDNWEISIGLSKDGYQSISFVNSIQTKDGGTHESYILNQLVDYLRAMIKKKYKVEVKPSEIKNHMFLFINCNIVNPAFSSQTKEKLITEVKEFGTKHEVSEKIAKLVFNSEIIKSLLDWIDQKNLAEERAELRKLNKNLQNIKTPKLIDATGSDRSKCSLALMEGDSALSSIRLYRDPKTFGAFPLRGKVLNVSELPNSKIIANEEIVQLMAALGLKLGEKPENLRYGKIYIYCDADVDGDAITALLINFFNKFWPELFEEHRIYRVLTPLIVAKKGKDTKVFYDESEYLTWANHNSLKNWEIEYKKGLAALYDEEYEQIVNNPKLILITPDTNSKDNLECWFGENTQGRKEKLLANSNNGNL